MSRRNNRGPADAYEVGYGKPPKHSRFKKGQSGNRKGRLKKRGKMKPVEELVLDALNERVVVTENGRRKSMAKIELALKQMSNKAAAGDRRAMKLMIELLKAMESPDIVRRVTLVFGEGERNL